MPDPCALERADARSHELVEPDPGQPRPAGGLSLNPPIAD
jgi:hypothetical protein